MRKTGCIHSPKVSFPKIYIHNKRKNSNFTIEDLGDTILTKWSRTASLVLIWIDIMYPWYDTLWYSCLKCATSIWSRENTWNKGNSAKELPSTLQKYQGCERQNETEELWQIRKAKETWELNALWDSRLDPEIEKWH